jgi:hypothetical protein
LNTFLSYSMDRTESDVVPSASLTNTVVRAGHRQIETQTDTQRGSELISNVIF